MSKERFCFLLKKQIDDESKTPSDYQTLYSEARRSGLDGYVQSIIWEIKSTEMEHKPALEKIHEEHCE